MLMTHGSRISAPAPEDRGRGSRLPRLAPALPLVVGVALALWLSARSSLFRDEAFTATSATLPTGELLELLTLREMNGAAHFLMVHALGLGSAPEWALRLPSIVAFAVAVTTVWRLLAREVRPGFVLAGVTLLALNSSALAMASFARQYALVLAVAAGCLLLARRLDDHPAARTAAGYALVGGVGFYTHFFVAFLVAVQVAFLLTGRARRLVLTVTVPVLFLFALPLAAFLLAGGDRGQLVWVPVTTVKSAISVPLQGLLTGASGAGLAAVALVPVVCFVFAAVLRRLPVDRLTMLAFLSLAGPVVLAVLASLATPLLIARYFIVAVPALVVLLVVVADRLWATGRLRSSVAALLLPLAATALAVPAAAAAADPGWVPALRYIAVNGSAADGVDTLGPSEWTAVAYYRERFGLGGMTWRADEQRRDPVGSAGYVQEGCWPERARQPTVWLLANSETGDAALRSATDYASCMGMRVASAKEFDGVTVFRLT